MFDETDNFGEHGYACWDIRVLIDKDGDLDLPINREILWIMTIFQTEEPFIQDFIPRKCKK